MSALNFTSEQHRTCQRKNGFDFIFEFEIRMKMFFVTLLIARQCFKFLFLIIFEFGIGKHFFLCRQLPASGLSVQFFVAINLIRRCIRSSRA